MARTDQERWDQRYGDGDWVDGDAPSPIVEDALPYLSPPGLVLDVACGAGRNSLFLARYGYSVVSVDISWRGLHMLTKRARSERLDVHPVHANLEQFGLPDEAFDIIVNTKFLMRDLFPEFQRALRPGGGGRWKSREQHHSRHQGAALSPAGAARAQGDKAGGARRGARSARDRSGLGSGFQGVLRNDRGRARERRRRWRGFYFSDS